MGLKTRLNGILVHKPKNTPISAVFRDGIQAF